MTRFLLALTLTLPLAPAASACVDGPRSSKCASRHDGAHEAEWRAYLTARRAIQKQRLIDYANARVFPLNDDQFGMVNIFVDEQDRPCAMAHLMWVDGNEALVRETSRRDNDVLLGDLERGALVDWVHTSGLTQAEAALIQEPDMYIGDELPTAMQQDLAETEADRLQAHFLAAAAQLDAYEAMSMEAALAALGKRIEEPPPSIPES